MCNISWTRLPTSISEDCRVELLYSIWSTRHMLYADCGTYYLFHASCSKWHVLVMKTVCTLHDTAHSWILNWIRRSYNLSNYLYISTVMSTSEPPSHPVCLNRATAKKMALCFFVAFAFVVSFVLSTHLKLASAPESFKSGPVNDRRLQANPIGLVVMILFVYIKYHITFSSNDEF